MRLRLASTSVLLAGEETAHLLLVLRPGALPAAEGCHPGRLRRLRLGSCRRRRRGARRPLCRRHSVSRPRHHRAGSLSVLRGSPGRLRDDDTRLGCRCRSCSDGRASRAVQRAAGAVVRRGCSGAGGRCSEGAGSGDIRGGRRRGGGGVVAGFQDPAAAAEATAGGGHQQLTGTAGHAGVDSDSVCERERLCSGRSRVPSRSVRAAFMLHFSALYRHNSR